MDGPSFFLYICDMAAPIGNQYWKIRSKDGRDKKYLPNELLDKANEYFQWCVDNPLYEAELVTFQGRSKLEKLPKMRVFSIQGFCNFADIMRQTFLNYEKDKDFLEVCTRIRGVIENQQFEGASANLLNPSIIARKLGLSDKRETEHSGSLVWKETKTYDSDEKANDSP